VHPGPGESRSQTSIQCLVVHPQHYQSEIGKNRLRLSATEFRLLLLLIENAPGIVRHDDLITRLFDQTGNMDSGVLRIYIHKIRNELVRAGGHRSWLMNVWGVDG
jgi:DNA-binding response OmpR family regulator